jgi:hypothetical protein
MGWMRRHWVALLGVIPLIPTALKWIGWLISRGGDADFVISRSSDPGWVGAMINWIINPPAWAIMPLIVAGFALIWLDVKRRRAKVTVSPITPQEVSAPYGIRPRRENSLSGAQLITLGQSILLAAIIVFMGGVLIGGTLILIGKGRATRQASDSVTPVNHPPKPPVAQSAPPPTLDAPVPSPPRTAEIQAAPQTPASPAREFVDASVTPEFLARLHETHTRIGVELYVAKYKGKWIAVSGKLLDVAGGWGKDRTPVVAAFARGADDVASILMVFRDKSIDQLAMIPKNQHIVVHGQISEVERHQITLENCEVVTTVIEGPIRSPRRRRGTAKRTPPKARPG